MRNMWVQFLTLSLLNILHENNVLVLIFLSPGTCTPSLLGRKCQNFTDGVIRIKQPCVQHGEVIVVCMTTCGQGIGVSG